MRVNNRHIGMKEAQKVGKWQPTSAKSKCSRLENWLRTNILMAALTLPSLEFVLCTMAPRLVLNPAASPRAFRSITVVVTSGSSKANSIPYIPSALVNGAYSHKRVQSSLYSACSLLSHLLAFPSSFFSLCCSSTTNNIPYFPSALVPSAYSYKRAQSLSSDRNVSF